MDTKENLVEPLLERADAYSKTTIELTKLKLVDKASDVLGMMICHFLASVVISFFVLFLTVGISLWLGEVVSSIYLGFILVASFYALVCLLAFFISPNLKAKIYNSVLTNILK